ncbi:MAG: phosphopantothenoylcysteine decarboxylase [Phycisphaerae bacterium]
MHILVTAGPTREYFDTVRFISNPSSGKMGFAIAAAAAAAGHHVSLVSGPVALPDPPGTRVVRVVSAEQMARACKRLFARCDVLFMTAAVCDYRPQRRLRRKLAKQPRPRYVRLQPTEDILASLGQHKRPSQLLIGFVLEDHDARRHAERKLRRKRLDVVVLNSPQNIGADQATVELLVRGQAWQRWPRTTKANLATRLVRLAQCLHRTILDTSAQPR